MSFSCPSNAWPRGNWDYTTACLVLFVVLTLVSLMGIVLFHYYKKRLGRLRKRSTSLLIVTFVSSVCINYVVLLREYFGRNDFNCTVLFAIHVLAVPFYVGPVIVKIYLYIHKLRRAQIRGALTFKAIRREQELAYEREDQKQLLNSVATQFKKFVLLRKVDASASNLTGLVSALNSKAVSDNKITPKLGESETNGVKGDGKIKLKSSYNDDVRNDSSNENVPPPGSPHNNTSKVNLLAKENSFDLNATDDDEEANKSGSLRKLPAKNKSVVELTTNSASRNSQSRNSSVTSAGEKKKRRSNPMGASFAMAGGLSDFSPDMPLDELVKHESSLLGLLVVVFLSAPYIAFAVIKIISREIYLYNCSGCAYEILDIAITAALSLIPAFLLIRAMRITWNAPDPLGIVSEVKYCLLVYTVFVIPTLIVYIVDPGGLDASGTFAWLIMECIMVFLLLAVQTYLQIYISISANKGIPKQINLFRVLENIELRQLFETHLIQEFSIENLRFWDRAITFKAHFNSLAPEDRKRIAFEIFRIFISPEHAVMQINLKAQNSQALIRFFQPPEDETNTGDNNPIDNNNPGATAATTTNTTKASLQKKPSNGNFLLGNRSKSLRDLFSMQNLDHLQDIPRDLFDGALKEAFHLMNDGLFRFLKSKTYNRFTTQYVDFEGDALRNQERGLGNLNQTVDEYLQTIGKFETAASPTNTDGRRVSFVPSRSKHRRKSSREDDSVSLGNSPGGKGEKRPSMVTLEPAVELSSPSNGNANRNPIFEEEEHSRPLSMRTKTKI